MRRPLICGNWKLNLGPAAATSFACYLRDRWTASPEVDVVVFPTALAIHGVVTALRGSGIAVGIQEVAAIPSGARTGANSAVMAREAGCGWLLVGHSERRQYDGETDEGVRDKVRAGLAAGLRPIVCVGESLAQRQAGEVDEVTHRQLGAALESLERERWPEVTIAYEPVWAIGTGLNATPEQAQQVHASLRSWLAAHGSPTLAASMRILYGGSVKEQNAVSLLTSPDLDGALVGGASLGVDSFLAIVAASLPR